MNNMSTVYLGDCLEIMPSITDGSMDMILADLPYGTTACRWDTIIPLEPLWEQYKRIIKPNGAIVLTASQPFASVLIASNLEWFKYEWIWSKGRGTGYQIAKYKPLVSHENVLIFGKGRVTYNPQMRYREKPRLSKNNGTNRQMLVSRGKEYIGDKPLDKRYPITVLDIGNDNQREKIHPTQKPVALMEYLIRTYTNEGETVLDNVMGSGTTGVVCKRTGREFIGIELNEDYFEMAQGRILAEEFVVAP